MHFNKSNNEFVYFIQSESGGPIKIGSANNVEKRLKQLQTGNHERLVVMHFTTGGKRLEGILHERFHKYNIFQEWFRENEELLDLINKLKQEDEAYGRPLSIANYLKEKYSLEEKELNLLTSFSYGAILPSTRINQDDKIKYWYMIDEYIEYQKTFPLNVLMGRFINCARNEGNQPHDRIIRKTRNIQLTYL